MLKSISKDCTGNWSRVVRNWTQEIKERGAELAILDRCHFHNGLSEEMIRDNTGWSHKTVHRVIKTLLARGWIEARPSLFSTITVYRAAKKGEAVLQLCVWNNPRL